MVCFCLFCLLTFVQGEQLAQQLARLAAKTSEAEELREKLAAAENKAASLQAALDKQKGSQKNGCVFDRHCGVLIVLLSITHAETQRVFRKSLSIPIPVLGRV